MHREDYLLEPLESRAALAFPSDDVRRVDSDDERTLSAGLHNMLGGARRKEAVIEQMAFSPRATLRGE